MSIHEKIRLFLIYIVAAIGVLAAIWSAAMLVGGFRAAGQLGSPENPLGEGVAFIAAAAIIGGTAVFYYVLGSKRQAPRSLLIVTAFIVFTLTAFASITQLMMVVDGSMGDQFVRGTLVRVNQAWKQLARIDQTMTDTYRAQIDYHEQRMAEEQVSGKGPRYKRAERSFNELRADYGSTLGHTSKTVQQGRSISDDAQGAKTYLAELRGKVRVFDRFTASEGIIAENLTARLDEIGHSLEELNQLSWIDRKVLVYKEVIRKIWEMITSLGTADLGFSLNALLSIIPDLIQILCTCLLVFLRPQEGDLGDDSDWTPFDRVWGETASDTAH